MAKFFGIAILGLVLLGPAGESVQGEQVTLAQVYGGGVQAYFNGEYEKAHALLSQAISLKTPDPRCYYFRGLANTKLGKAEEAAADFKEGARLEALDVGGNYPVSKALIRVQGQTRQLIEISRRQAKIDLKALQEERQRVRYEQLELRTKEVKRKDFNDDSGAAPPANLPALPADATRNITNPFDTPTDKLSSSDLLGGQNSRPSEVNPTASQPIASSGNDPFAKPTDAIPDATAGNAAAPGAGNPFATTPAAGADPANPFATKQGAGADPADPFAPKPAAGADAADPFAPKPAAGADVADPFAPKPAAGADVADPFAPKPAAGNDPAKPDAGDPPKKGIFGSLFRAVGAGVTKSASGDDADGGEAAPKPDDGAAEPADAPAKPAAKPADPFGGNDPFGGGAAKPAPKPANAPAKPADPFGGKDPFGAAPKPANAPAKPAAKPADPFGGNDPFKQ